MIKILGNNQQLIFDYIQNNKLHISNLDSNDLLLKREDDVR